MLPAGKANLASLVLPLVAGTNSWLQLGERPGHRSR
jgi:hypothetical protein